MPSSTKFTPTKNPARLVIAVQIPLRKYPTTCDWFWRTQIYYEKKGFAGHFAIAVSVDPLIVGHAQITEGSFGLSTLCQKEACLRDGTWGAFRERPTASLNCNYGGFGQGQTIGGIAEDDRPDGPEYSDSEKRPMSRRW